MNEKNSDPQEIAKFDRIAKTWWDPNGEMKPLHQINPIRADYIKRHSKVEGKRLLDIGCGGGLLTEALASSNAIVTGIDLSSEALFVAEQHAKENNLNIHYQKRSAENLAKQGAQFDVVTCMEMLEHVPDPSQVICAAAKLTRAGGKVFFSTLHRNPKAYLFAIIAAEYLLNMLPKGTHDYAKFIKPSELNTWAEDAGLQLVEMAGIQYSPFTQQFSLSKNTSVNYIACYTK